MKRLFALAAALALTCSAAAAQDVWGWSVIIPSVTGTDQLGLHLREQVQRAPQTAAPPVAAGPPARPVSLTFTPSPERRAANFARFIDARKGGDPTSARQLEALLNDPALMPKIDGHLRAQGLRADNVADAYAVWWIQAWQTVKGDTGDPSAPAIRAVQAQSEHALLASPSLLANDEVKQALAEGLLIQAVIMSAALDQVKQDPAQLQKLGQVVRQSARQVGLDLDSMVLSDQGFTPAGG